MTAATVERDGELRVVEGSARARWNPFTRIAFRFCFLYFGLFCLLYPQLLFAKLNRVDLNGFRLHSGGFHWVQDKPAF